MLLAISNYGCLLCYILFLPLRDYANEANLHTRTKVHGIETEVYGKGALAPMNNFACKLHRYVLYILYIIFYILQVLVREIEMKTIILIGLFVVTLVYVTSAG